MEKSALLTDMYQLTMAHGYWKVGMEQKEAVFHYFFRSLPFHGGFVITCGLAKLIEYIRNFAFNDSDLTYLASLKYFDDKFLHFLKEMRLTITLDAMPEGTVCFPFEPIIRVQGPLIQCQLLETPLLNLMNFSSLIATKASRVKIAAGGDPVMEFGLRRAHGIDGGLTASRSSFVGGVDSTSNLLAGKLYGIPVRGTQAHSWVMAFENELEAFQKYSEAFPNNCILLVDTYDSLEGVRHAIEVGKTLKAKGKNLLGIRLDSGDLARLSIESRKLLDDAGFQECNIYASNELDEYVISDLKKQGAKINFWGVGTSLVTGKDQSHLDGVYKLSAIRDPGSNWKYKLKLSEQFQKISNPGLLQVRRYYNQEMALADIIYDINEGIDEFPEFIDPLDFTKKKRISRSFTHADLLKPIFSNGKQIYETPPLADIRNNTLNNLSKLPKETKRFLNPNQYPIGFETKLQEIKLQLIDKARVKKEI